MGDKNDRATRNRAPDTPANTSREVGGELSMPQMKAILRYVKASLQVSVAQRELPDGEFADMRPSLNAVDNLAKHFTPIEIEAIIMNRDEFAEMLGLNEDYEQENE